MKYLVIALISAVTIFYGCDKTKQVTKQLSGTYNVEKMTLKTFRNDTLRRTDIDTAEASFTFSGGSGTYIYDTLINEGFTYEVNGNMLTWSQAGDTFPRYLSGYEKDVYINILKIEEYNDPTTGIPIKFETFWECRK